MPHDDAAAVQIGNTKPLAGRRDRLPVIKERAAILFGSAPSVEHGRGEGTTSVVPSDTSDGPHSEDVDGQQGVAEAAHLFETLEENGTEEDEGVDLRGGEVDEEAGDVPEDDGEESTGDHDIEPEDDQPEDDESEDPEAPKDNEGPEDAESLEGPKGVGNAGAAGGATPPADGGDGDGGGPHKNGRGSTDTRSADLPAHPAANLFPMMSDAELQALAKDIKENGLQRRIVRHKGRTLDGRNREKACGIAGVEPLFEEWDGKGSPVVYVLSQNLHRRHLSESQRAMVAAEALPLLAAEANERKLAGLRRGEEVPVRANLPERDDPGRSRDKAAELVGASGRLVGSAVPIVTSGIPELIDLVKSDKVAVSAAKELARLPEAEQRDLVKQGPAAIKSFAAHRRAERRAAAAKASQSNDQAETQSPPGPPAAPTTMPTTTSPASSPQDSPVMVPASAAHEESSSAPTESAPSKEADTEVSGPPAAPSPTTNTSLPATPPVPETPVETYVEQLTDYVDDFVKFLDPAENQRIRQLEATVRTRGSLRPEAVAALAKACEAAAARTEAFGRSLRESLDGKGSSQAPASPATGKKRRHAKPVRRRKPVKKAAANKGR